MSSTKKQQLKERLELIFQTALIKFKDSITQNATEVVTEELCSIDNQPDIFINEETGEEYYFEYNEETLQEAKIILRVNSRGQRKRLLKCGPGKVAKSIGGRKVCVTQGSRAKLVKKIAIKKANRTKKARGAGYKKRSNIKRQRAMKKRKQQGL